ncbi:MAG: hypothetical protein OXQ92_04225 [Boseongicola sp.]|nr:hypothetical protein [Boseongicola sp.]MDD9978233.1 hypothetical protein [Boseongicola sp.]
MILLGRLIAWGMVILGGLRLAMGVYVANAFVTQAEWEAANSRYLGSKTSGEVIDQGLLWIAIGVGFGLLTHIAAGRSGKPSDSPQDNE